MKDTESNHELLLQYLDGNLPPEKEAQVADLLHRDPEARAFLREVAEQAVTVADLERAEENRGRALETRHDEAENRHSVLRRIGRQHDSFIGWPWAVAAAALIALIANVYFLLTNVKPEIAHITELSGTVQWTGDGGRVVHDIEVGSALRGGTLESLSADSWATLAFRDGSTLTISGKSMLTISEHERKELYLRGGSLSADVAPQPKGKPMHINTPTANVEVLGTALSMETEPASTILRVSEGRVRVTRLVDGSVTEVPAKHQVVASVNPKTNFSVNRRPEPVHSWQSNLPTGATHGAWLPDLGESGGGLHATPMLLYSGEKSKKKLVPFHIVIGSVSSGQSSPVALTHGAKFRIRGQIESTGDVEFGFTTHIPEGGFAAKCAVRHRFEVLEKSDENLDVEFHLGDFNLMAKETPDSLIGLIFFEWWCSTDEVNAGLSISSIELIPAER